MRLKGLKIYARNGRWYAYVRETGQKLDGGFKGGKAEFLAHLATPAMLSAYSRAIDAQPIRSHGTLGSLIDFYKTKPKWRDLSPRTQADYEKALTFLEPTMDTPLVEIGPGDIAETRDRAVAAHYAKFANDCLSVLSAAFGTCPTPIVPVNPASPNRSEGGGRLRPVSLCVACAFVGQRSTLN